MNRKIFLLLFLFILKIEVSFHVERNTQKPIIGKRKYLSTVKIGLKKYTKLPRNDSCDPLVVQKNVFENPYCVLENSYDEKTIDFINKTNGIAEWVFTQSKLRYNITYMIKKYSKYENYDNFEKHGLYYYFMYENDSLEHKILKRRLVVNGKEEDFVNPNKMKGNKEIKCWWFSLDKTIMAYHLYDEESKQSELRFITSKGKHLNDILKVSSTTNIAFLFNNASIVYTDYEKNNKLKKVNIVLYYHNMGTKQVDDIKLSDKLLNNVNFDIQLVSSDGKYLFISVYNDSFRSICYCKVSELNKNKQLSLKVLIKDVKKYKYEVIDSEDNDVYLLANKESDYGSIIKLTINKNQNHTKSIVTGPVKGRRIEKVVLAGKNYLVFTAFIDLQSYIYVLRKDNFKLEKILHVGIGLSRNLFGEKNVDEVFLTFGNPIIPLTIFRAIIPSFPNFNKLTLEKFVKGRPEDYNVLNIETKVVNFIKKDKTKIDGIIFYPNDIKFNGNNPLILESFAENKGSTSTVSSFSPSRYLFIKHFNGIVCYVNTRGNRFNGKEWFNKGIKENHNNRFEDFIHYVKSLINNNYTKPEKFAIYGSGTSGIVIANVTKQHPKLIGTSIIQGTLLDLLSLNTFDDYSSYLEEFGNPEDEEHSYLRYFSPLHNIKALKKYVQWPSTFVTGTIYPQYEITESSLKYLNELYHQLLKDKTNQTNPIIARFINIHDNQKGSKVEMHRNAINELIFISQTLDLKWKNI